MSQTPVRQNIRFDAPGAPRKARIERTITPNTTITNLRLKFESEEAMATPSPLNTAVLIEDEDELEFINSVMNAPLNAFSYEGLAEIMAEAE